MEKHNTHVLLDSNSSSIHDYEEDENGNIKIDIDEDVPYNYYVEKKTKSPTKEIIIENNNIFRKEYEENFAEEENNFKNQEKSEKKKKKDILIKPEEYRFESKKIQPCFNEVEVEYDKNKEIDKSNKNKNKNKSHEFKENEKNSENNLLKDNKKRNDLNLLNFSGEKNLINLKLEDEDSNEYQKKETPEKIKDKKKSNKNFKNNKKDKNDKNNNDNKENEIANKPEQNHRTILLKGKNQYNNDESDEGNINKKDDDNNKIKNPEIINENNISESNDKFLKDQKTPQKIENKDNINNTDNKNKKKIIDNEKNINDNNEDKNEEFNDSQNSNDIQLLREKLNYNGEEYEKNGINNKDNNKILGKNNNRDNKNLKLNKQNGKEKLKEKKNKKGNNNIKNGQFNENSDENIGDNENNINNSKENFDDFKENNNNSKNSLSNNKNNNLKKHKGQKINSSLDLDENNKIKDKRKKQKKIKQNVTEPLQLHQKNISNPSLQNMSKTEQIENGDNLPMLLDKFENSDNFYDVNNNRDKENNINENENGINKSNKEGEEEFLRDKNENGNLESHESQDRIRTEEYFENNLQNEKKNKKKSGNENSNSNINKSNENFDDINSQEGKIDEIILSKQALPMSYLDKIRHNDVKINKLIPKKKRAFVSKLVNPHHPNEDNKKEEIVLPISSICFMTNSHILQKRREIMESIINDCFFSTKIYMKKGEEDLDQKSDKILISKVPKVYKKAIISPDKNGKFRKKTKKGKKSKNLIDVNDNNRNSNIFIDMQKSKRKNEKISLISKDKSPNEKGNLIVRRNSKILKEISGEFDENDQVDISIHFSNKKPIGIRNNIFRNYKKLKYPVSAKKKRGKLEEYLFNDLKELHDKLDNKDEYFKQKCYNFHYDRHVGAEKTCPICREVRKRGKKSEREKGLFSAFSFKEFKDKNKRSLSKLKVSLQQKDKENSLLNNYDKKRFYRQNLISLNDNIDSDFKKKYMQFNGMNRLHKLKRCDSGSILSNYRYNNDVKSFRSLNFGREIEKNGDDLERIQYHALRNYFND